MGYRKHASWIGFRDLTPNRSNLKGRLFSFNSWLQWGQDVMVGKHGRAGGGKEMLRWGKRDGWGDAEA